MIPQLSYEKPTMPKMTKAQTIVRAKNMSEKTTEAIRLLMGGNLAIRNIAMNITSGMPIYDRGIKTSESGQAISDETTAATYIHIRFLVLRIRHTFSTIYSDSIGSTMIVMTGHRNCAIAFGSITSV